MNHNIMRFILAFIVAGWLAACASASATTVPTETSLPPTSTPAPTDTPVPSATRRPTNTPRPTATARPTNTPQPTIAAPSGFKPIEGGGITLWLPQSFEGGSMTGKDRELMIAGLKKLGGEFTRVATQFEGMADNLLFLAVDSKVNQQGGVTTVNVVEVPIFSSMKPVTLAKMMAEQLPQQIKGIKIGEVEAVELPRYPAAHFTAQLSLNNLSIKEAIYLIKADDATYMVTFAALADEFEELQSAFEQSIQTFTVKP
jgi:hypothetical protein